MKYKDLIRKNFFTSALRTSYDKEKVEELAKILNQMEDFVIDVSEKQKHKLSLLAKFIKNLNSKKVIIEGAHVYVDLFDKEGFLKEILLFKYIFQKMMDSGIESCGWMLVDDYTHNFTGQKSDISMNEIIDFMRLNNVDFVDEVHSEGGQEIIEKAKKIVELLGDNNNLKYIDDNIYLGRKKILLYDGKKGKYSCALLDAAFTLLKYAKADTIVNILPYSSDNSTLDEFNSYSGQQYKVRTILREYGNKNPDLFPRFFNVFFEKEVFKDGKVDIQIGLPNFARNIMRDNELENESKYMNNEKDCIIF